MRGSEGSEISTDNCFWLNICPEDSADVALPAAQGRIMRSNGEEVEQQAVTARDVSCNTRAIGFKHLLYCISFQSLSLKVSARCV